jgi:hypothetical protein
VSGIKTADDLGGELGGSAKSSIWLTFIDATVALKTVKTLVFTGTFSEFKLLKT